MFWPKVGEKTENMEPHARVEQCFFKWERLLLKLCGFNFIGEPFKPKLLTYFVCGLVFAAISCSVYTIICYEMSAKLFCVLALLMMIQVQFDTISL